MENLQKDNMKPFKSNKLYEIPVFTLFDLVHYFSSLGFRQGLWSLITIQGRS